MHLLPLVHHIFTLLLLLRRSRIQVSSHSAPPSTSAIHAAWATAAPSSSVGCWLYIPPIGEVPSKGAPLPVEAWHSVLAGRLQLWH